MAKRQGWERGQGKFSGSSIDKDPIRPDRSIDSSGNPKAKSRQLDYDTLLNQNLSDKLPRKA